MAARTGAKKPVGKAGAKGKKGRRRGCGPVGCILLLVLLLLTAAFALDQYGIVAIPLVGEKIPRVLPGAKPLEEEATESELLSEESEPADAEAEAQRRLDEQEGGGESRAPESEPGATVESGPEGRREVVVEREPPVPQTESEAANLSVTLPPGGLRSLDPKSPEAKELRRRIESVGAILQASKAKSAAETLQGMPLELQVEILRTLEESTAAKILEEMPADQRTKIAMALIR